MIPDVKFRMTNVVVYAFYGVNGSGTISAPGSGTSLAATVAKARANNAKILLGINDGTGDGKTNFNGLLYLHFLASAYVVLVLVEPHRASLHRLHLLVLVGQQALASFLASILLAWGLGIVLDVIGRNIMTTTLANLAGFAGLIMVAKLAQAYKAQKGPAAPRAHGTPAMQPAE